MKTVHPTSLEHVHKLLVSAQYLSFACPIILSAGKGACWNNSVDKATRYRLDEWTAAYGDHFYHMYC